MKTVFIIVFTFFCSQLLFAQFEKESKTYDDSLFGNPVFSQELAKDVIENCDNDSIRSEWHKKLGVAFYYNFQLDSAIMNYLNGIKFSNDSLFISKCYSNIGVCYVEKQEYDSAIHFYTQAIVALSLSSEPFLGIIHSNLSKLYGDLEIYKKGIEHGQKGVVILANQKDDFRSSLANCYLNLGANFAGQGEQDSSIFYNSLAKKAFHSIGKEMLEIAALRNIIKAYDLKNEQDSVLVFLKEFERLLENNPSNFYQMILHQAKGIYFYKTSQIKKAQKEYENALELANKLNEIILIKDLHQNLALTYKELGNYEKAYDALLYYHKINDSLEHVKTGLKILEVEEKFQNAKKDKEIAILSKDIEIADKNAELQLLHITEQNQRIENRNLLIVITILAGVTVLILTFLFLKRRELKVKNKWFQSENERLRTERRLLQSQMNPHFIFNTLNSIQRFVLENDTKSATGYIGKFGKLLRRILDFTRLEKVTLEEELTVLASYLEFEKLRFGNKFSYVIEDQTGCSDDIEVPPLIVQPFVENAILHGFKSIAVKGLIKITTSLDGDFLLISVEDNGVGRIRSENQSDFDKKSHGSEITEERLKSEGQNNELYFIDLKSEDGGASGTKVILKIEVN